MSCQSFLHLDKVINSCRFSLSGIKKSERSQAVLGETRMWAACMRFEPNLLDQRDRILDFGEREVFEVGRGIDNEPWPLARLVRESLRDYQIQLLSDWVQ